MRVVLLYCGLFISLREVAGNFTGRKERISDEAVRKRLKACHPWVKALLTEMLPLRALSDLPSGLRFLVFDGSSIEGPGATGTDYRLHIFISLITLEFTHLFVTDKHTGESLKHFPLEKGDVAIVDRGLCHANAIKEKLSEGADVVARYNSASMPLYHPYNEMPLDLVGVLEQSSKATYQSFGVLAGAASETEKLAGYIVALRLPSDQAEIARRRCLFEHLERDVVNFVPRLYFWQNFSLCLQR